MRINILKISQMANSIEPDQEQSDLDLHCLVKRIQKNFNRWQNRWFLLLLVLDVLVNVIFSLTNDQDFHEMQACLRGSNNLLTFYQIILHHLIYLYEQMK